MIPISTYVMSDIHGCYDDMMQMLKQIEFSTKDTLILAGDYIDRGPKSYEMLQWIVKVPDNVKLLKGNHEEEFAQNVKLMNEFLSQNNLNKDSNKDTKLIYEFLKQLSDRKENAGMLFDYYGTIKELIEIKQVTLSKLNVWVVCIENMEYYLKCRINGRQFVIVHAGYTDSIEEDMDDSYDSLEEFYLYARDDAYIFGGIRHGIVVAGHTPTTLEEELPYNDGNVYQAYDKDMDCKFYDIDCGCASRGKIPNAKLACIRLDDEKIFYI